MPLRFVLFECVQLFGELRHFLELYWQHRYKKTYHEGHPGSGKEQMPSAPTVEYGIAPPEPSKKKRASIGNVDLPGLAANREPRQRRPSEAREWQIAEAAADAADATAVGIATHGANGRSRRRAAMKADQAMDLLHKQDSASAQLDALEDPRFAQRIQAGPPARTINAATELEPPQPRVRRRDSSEPSAPPPPPLLPSKELPPLARSRKRRRGEGAEVADAAESAGFEEALGEEGATEAQDAAEATEAPRVAKRARVGKASAADGVEQEGDVLLEAKRSGAAAELDRFPAVGTSGEAASSASGATDHTPALTPDQQEEVMAAAKELKAAEKQDTRIVHGWKLCWKPRANSTQPGDFTFYDPSGKRLKSSSFRQLMAQLQRDASDKAEDKAVAQATVARVRAHLEAKEEAVGLEDSAGKAMLDARGVQDEHTSGVNAGMNLVPAAKVASLNISEVSLPASDVPAEPAAPLVPAASVPPADTAAREPMDQIAQEDATVTSMQAEAAEMMTRRGKRRHSEVEAAEEIASSITASTMPKVPPRPAPEWFATSRIPQIMLRNVPQQKNEVTRPDR